MPRCYWMLATLASFFKCIVPPNKMGDNSALVGTQSSSPQQSHSKSPHTTVLHIDTTMTGSESAHDSPNDRMEVPDQSRLAEVVRDGSFWTISDEELLHVVKHDFIAELEHLKHAYSVRSKAWKEVPDSPSRILYPADKIYDEVNRSLVGLLSLRWINDNNYDKFVRGQAPAIQLQKDSFKWIRDVFEAQGIIKCNDYRLYALVTSIVTNDLGKSTSFIQSYLDETGEDIKHENHDMILNRAAQRGMVPALERLQPEYRDAIKKGIKLGAEFNVGQLAQAENAPASLAPLLELVGQEKAWNMRWMEQLLDLAGAAGHEDHTGAKMLTEPVFQSYRSVYGVVTGIVRGELTLRQGYDQNLVTRYQLIVDSGWRPPQSMKVDVEKDRALMRLFCMANVANPQRADLYYTTFYSGLVGDSIRQTLVQYLSRDGTVEEPAAQPTYGPGMMNLALKNFSNLESAPEGEEKEKAEQKIVAAMIRYLTRVYAKPPSPEMNAEGDVTVIERDIRVTCRDIIQSEEFLRNPNILDDAPLPEDVVANRAVSVSS